MTYFLEKYFELDSHSNLFPTRFYHAIIRPCEWDYTKARAFILGQLKDKVMELGGQVAGYEDKKMSMEEWLIKLELEKGISPSFEDTYVRAFGDFNDYHAKTVDLHTKEVLFDNLDEMIVKLTTNR